MKSLLHPSHRDALIERVSLLEPDTPRRWGRMSAHGMVCHLTDAFLICLGERPAVYENSLVNRTLIRFIAVNTPLPWLKGVPTVPEADQERRGTRPTDFEADLARMKTTLHDFVSRLNPDSMRHPLFGRMSAAEWGRWGYRHVDHHARQFGL